MIGFSCVYAILSYKRKSIYEDLFYQLKEYCDHKEPRSITFELAAINAAATVFPSSNRNGCFFHLSQCLYRKIQVLGHQSLYGNNKEFAQKCKMVAALAHVPPAEVLAVFKQLKENLGTVKELEQFVSYFEINYVGEGSSGKKPKFPIEFWNVRCQVVGDLPKTTNYVEGWHKRMSHAVGCTHPTLAALIEILKKEHSITNFLVIHSDMRVEKVKSKKYAKTSDRIKRMTLDYDKYRPLYNLELIASNVKLV